MINISSETFNKNINRLTNQLWKLIPMREHEENWKGQLETVLIEIIGLQELFNMEGEFLILVSKLKGLQTAEIEFMTYRKTVFECISLLREGIKYE